MGGLWHCLTHISSDINKQESFVARPFPARLETEGYAVSLGRYYKVGAP